MYQVYLLPRALQETRRLPGHVRQRMKRIIDQLAQNPRPPGSIELANVTVAKPHVTLHRFRIEK